mmetsp:Transcript_36530/g.66235  ORF Transcript_36530/g.66235 Transcript_36530/m.66235 type:complete len:201 (+) Transcript_36530:83-685(+)|eukprot:CAMPEP_0197659244 /NCGR_PEP_ID=MMETSP1338-20131121/46813_1 /TAXON_ID=43686 ORGANISM="Pelagodinium beii, Strain RCC1491" /NCGR_SAMPLE_ID=MMETSP1338 /ASSEMBLY_ACC=CAM_ASM_000754 /LENGTH=200 /DNA_ID=CAMNT_0043236073 /DNA_START=72 /DNA_END=674 /DNA_ORIENTATION=+
MGRWLQGLPLLRLLLLSAAWLPSSLAAPEVTDEVIAARKWKSWGGPGGRMANAGPAELVPIVSPGDTIFFRAYSGKHLDVSNNKVYARRSLHGARQAFGIDKREAGSIHPGDRVYITSYSGMRVEVNGEEVRAVSPMRGPRQEFVIERMGGGTSPIVVGDTIFLKAHTGKHLDVVGTEVSARFVNEGFGFHALKVEKPSR